MTVSIFEILKVIERCQLWIRSLDDIVCVFTMKNKDAITYYIYLSNGVEVEIACRDDDCNDCSVKFIGRRLIIENLDVIEDFLDVIEDFLVRE